MPNTPPPARSLALALAPVAALWMHIASPRYGGANTCRMTYMHPAYYPMDPSHGVQDGPSSARGHHSLFMYRERSDPTVTAAFTRIVAGARRDGAGTDASSWTEEGQQQITASVPGVFVPGNGGSYKQVRSIASESARAAERRRRGRVGTGERHDVTTGGDVVTIDWFALDFREELSAFHGDVLRSQITYAADALRRVLSLYPPGTHALVVGHSMGGVVARGALLALSRAGVDGDGDAALPRTTLLTLATPHASSPAAMQPSMGRALGRLNAEWRRAAHVLDVALVSVSGGDRDRQVTARHARVDALAAASTPNVSSIAVDVGSIPGAEGVSTDHQCIVWCNQVVKAGAEGLLDVAEAAEGARRLGAARSQSETEGETAPRGPLTAAARLRIMAARLSPPGRDLGAGAPRGGFPLARHALTWMPSMVPAMVAHACAALAVVTRDRSSGSGCCVGVGGGCAASVSWGLLARVVWWATFVGVAAVSGGLGAAPWLVPTSVGGVTSERIGDLTALCAVFVSSAASLALEGLALEWVTARARGGAERYGGGEGAGQSPWVTRPGLAFAATAATAAACAWQPALGLVIGSLVRLGSAVGNPAAAGAPTATLHALLSLQAATMLAPSGVAAARVLVESRGTRWVGSGGVEDVALALASTLPALLPAGFSRGEGARPAEAGGKRVDGVTRGGERIEAVAYWMAAVTAAAAAVPGRAYLAQHAAAVASTGPLVAGLCRRQWGRAGWVRHVRRDKTA